MLDARFKNMKVNDLRCSITLLIDVIKKRALPRSTNLKQYELEVAACLAWSFIQIREREGLPFQAPFLSITMTDSLTEKERSVTGNTTDKFIQSVIRHFQEKHIDFSLGFSDRDILDFQMKKVASIEEIAERIEKDQDAYEGSTAILGYYLSDLIIQDVPRIQFDHGKIRDVVICGFNKIGDQFIWCSLRDVPITKVVPPWLML